MLGRSLQLDLSGHLDLAFLESLDLLFPLVGPEAYHSKKNKGYYLPTVKVREYTINQVLQCHTLYTVYF